MLASYPSAQLTAGTAFVPFQLARKPNDVDAPAARLPLYAALRAVTVAPLWLSVVFQD